MVAALASRLQTVLAPGERAVIALNDSPLQIAAFLAIENDRTAESAHLLEGNERLRLVVPLSDPAVASLEAWIASGDSEWRDYVSFEGDQPCYLQFTCAEDVRAVVGCAYGAAQQGAFGHALGAAGSLDLFHGLLHAGEELAGKGSVLVSALDPSGSCAFLRLSSEGRSLWVMMSE